MAINISIYFKPTFAGWIWCDLELSAIFRIETHGPVDPAGEDGGKRGLPRVESRTVAPVCLQPLPQLSREGGIHAAST